MKIVVLAKQVPDTGDARILDMQSGLLDRAASEQVADEINERTMEVALQYKDNNPSTEVVAVTMGPEDSTASSRKMLAMGADSAFVLADAQLAGSDAVQTARVLSEIVDHLGGDLILAGNKSTDGQSGVVPAMVADLQGIGLAGSLDEVTISPSAVRGKVLTEGGVLTIQADLPAVASVTEKAAEPRFPNFKNIMKAKKKPLTVWSLADLGIEAGPHVASAQSVMVAAQERPPKQAGVKIEDDGTAAAQLADFLSENRYV